MELQEEMTPADVVLLLGSVPERTSDLVYWLDEDRLRYRHGPAFPTLGSLIAHLVESATRIDGLLRHAHLDGQTTADVRAAMDPGQDQELSRPLQEALEDFARVRRRTVDLLHGFGTVPRLADMVPLLLEQVLDDAAERFLVFHEEDAQATSFVFLRFLFSHSGAAHF